MMLREAVLKVLFGVYPELLLPKQIEECNTFIDNYHKVKELMEE